MEWISTQDELPKVKHIPVVFVRCLNHKGEEYFAEAEWNNKQFEYPYYGQDLAGAHGTVTHWLIPSYNK